MTKSTFLVFIRPAYAPSIWRTFKTAGGALRYARKMGRYHSSWSVYRVQDNVMIAESVWQQNNAKRINQDYAAWLAQDDQAPAPQDDQAPAPQDDQDPPRLCGQCLFEQRQYCLLCGVLPARPAQGKPAPLGTSARQTVNEIIESENGNV